MLELLHYMTALAVAELTEDFNTRELIEALPQGGNTRNNFKRRAIEGVRRDFQRTQDRLAS